MRSGPLRNRITIFAVATTKDSFGQPVDAEPQEMLTCWASIFTATSKEIYTLGGAGFTGQVTHKITIRFPDVLPQAGALITFTKRGITRTFLLQTPPSDPDERGRELDLMVLEKSK